MLTAIALIVVGAFAWRVMTVDERLRGIRAVAGACRTASAVFRRALRYQQQDLQPFTETLRGRSALALVTPALVAVSVVIFGAALLGGGVPREPAALLAWGASIGPRTTNGEWWRLITALFVPVGFLALVVNAAALFQLGLLVERLVGAFPFATAFFAGGVAAGLVNLRLQPTAVAAGDSGGVLALYGLFAVLVLVGWVRRGPVRVPLVALKWLAPVTAVFALYNFAGGWSAAGTAALASGVALGLAVARDSNARRPPWRRTALALAAGLVIAIATGASMRGILDVRPEIDRLAELESRTSAAYGAAVAQLRKGRTTAAALADLIDRTIMPEIHAAGARVNGLEGVPPSDAWRVEGAREYLRLREESWSLRSRALRDTGEADGETERTPSRALRAAESDERQSLDVLERIREGRPRN